MPFGATLGEVRINLLKVSGSVIGSVSSSQSESESTASIIADQEVQVINLTKNS